MSRLFPGCALKFLTLLLALSSLVGTSFATPLEARVGVIASLSGNWASMGKMTQEGAELAKEELARTGGPTIVFSLQDSNEASSGAGAVTAYQNLRKQGFSLFIGPTGTPGGLALVPIVKKDPVVVISASVAVEPFHRAGQNIFNAQGAFEVLSRLLAQRAFNDGARRIAIFASQQPYESIQADAFAEEFVKLGGTISARVDPIPESTDVRSEALRIVSSSPDGVFFAVYNQLPLAAKELEQLGLKKLKYAPVMDPSRFEGARGALNGLVFAKLGTVRAEFINQFRERFGHNPDFPADAAYDAVMALGRAIQKQGSADPISLPAVLLGTTFMGASGQFHFDDQGGALRKPTVWRVEGENLVLIVDEAGKTVSTR